MERSQQLPETSRPCPHRALRYRKTAQNSSWAPAALGSSTQPTASLPSRKSCPDPPGCRWRTARPDEEGEEGSWLNPGRRTQRKAAAGGRGRCAVTPPLLVPLSKHCAMRGSGCCNSSCSTAAATERLFIKPQQRGWGGGGQQRNK